MPKLVHNALSPLKIRSLTRAGRYADGNGLYPVVDDGGAKRWVLDDGARQASRHGDGQPATRLASRSPRAPRRTG
jgi:hypothetical protein